jgi:hypothetical protein
LRLPNLLRLSPLGAPGALALQGVPGGFFSDLGHPVRLAQAAAQDLMWTAPRVNLAYAASRRRGDPPEGASRGSSVGSVSPGLGQQPAGSTLGHAACAALRVFCASTAVQQPQPFGIETRDEFKRVHTSRVTIARCMGTRWLLAKNAAQCWRKIRSVAPLCPTCCAAFAAGHHGCALTCQAPIYQASSRPIVLNGIA